jgi:hypothetical protein
MNSNKPASKPKLDKTLSMIINFGTVVVFIGLAVIIYWYFFSGKRITKFECFDNPATTMALANSSRSGATGTAGTIYEKAIQTVFANYPRLICNLTPTPTNNICMIDDQSYVKFNFPVHMIKLIDGSILAVFNDGRLYRKDTLQNTMWQGPLDNSLPNDTIPLRMITLAPDLATLLGVGYDNQLYLKTPTAVGTVDITAIWKPVPNNTGVIYVLFDADTANMISIDTSGKLWIKVSSDFTSDRTELITKLDRPVLRLYYDNNGYMLAIDNNFDMYQFSELNWKTSPLNLQRGHNASKIADVLYDNDGRMYGLVFNTQASILQTMKQDMAFYLGNFLPLDQQAANGSSKTGAEFVLSDQDVLKSKVGNIDKYLQTLAASDTADDDTNVAYQKMILQTRADLRTFCAARNNGASNSNFDNYDLLSQVESNDDKISSLKSIINDLIIYEPDKARILEKYPVISN